LRAAWSVGGVGRPASPAGWAGVPPLPRALVARGRSGPRRRVGLLGHRPSSRAVRGAGQAWVDRAARRPPRTTRGDVLGALRGLDPTERPHGLRRGTVRSGAGSRGDRGARRGAPRPGGGAKNGRASCRARVWVVVGAG